MAKKSTEKSKVPSSEPAAVGPPQEVRPLPQEASKLMQLPQELRDKIYSGFFSQVSFVDGRRLNHHAPALLRTCRRIHSEIGKSWLQHVHFSFNGPESMLNTLARFPPETLSHVRHVRVEGSFLRLSYPDKHGSYQTHAVLQLLPGLKLDRLTVTATRPPSVAYATLKNLIMSSSGWKELYFTSWDSLFLGYKRDPLMFVFGVGDTPFRRRPQPADWQNRLEARDGKLSKPSVAIYRAKTAGARNDIALDPDEGVPLVQKLAEGQTVENFDADFDECIRDPKEMMKASLVIVKRGKGVDYEQRYDCAGTDYDIRADSGKSKWEDIKTFVFRLGEENPGYDDDDYDDDDDFDPDFEHDYMDDDDDEDEYGLEDSDDGYDDSDDDDDGLPALEPVHITST